MHIVCWCIFEGMHEMCFFSLSSYHQCTASAVISHHMLSNKRCFGMPRLVWLPLHTNIFSVLTASWSEGPQWWSRNEFCVSKDVAICPFCWNACRHTKRKVHILHSGAKCVRVNKDNLWGLNMIRAVSVDFVNRTALFDRFIEDWWLKRQTHTCLWETNEACSRDFIKTEFCV